MRGQALFDKHLVRVAVVAFAIFVGDALARGSKDVFATEVAYAKVYVSHGQIVL